MNEDGAGFPDYRPGTSPVIIKKYPYIKGRPVPCRMNLKTEKFYFPDDKAVTLADFEFTPLAVYNLGKAVMYPTPDPVTKELVLKKRNQLAVVAALPQFDGMVVSFLITSYGAEAFLAQTKMQHKSSHGLPALCPQQLVYIVEPYPNKSNGFSFCSLKFSVRVATPRYGAELKEFAEAQDLFCKEHMVEYLTRNPASEQNPPAFLREVGKMLTPDEVAEIFALAADKKRDNSRLDGNEEEEENEDTGYLYTPAPVYTPALNAPAYTQEQLAAFWQHSTPAINAQPVAALNAAPVLNAAPADQGKAIKPEWAAEYKKQYDKVWSWMSADQRDRLLNYTGYDDFVKKGNELRTVQAQIVVDIDELPF